MRQYVAQHQEGKVVINSLLKNLHLKVKLDCAPQVNWPKDVVEMVIPPSVKVATQEGQLAELPKFLLLLAGALDGPAGEALAAESPVVIALEVSSTVPLLSSARWNSLIFCSRTFNKSFSEHQAYL